METALVKIVRDLSCKSKPIFSGLPGLISMPRAFWLLGHALAASTFSACLFLRNSPLS